MSELPKGWAWTKITDLAHSEPNALTDGPFGSKLKTEHYVANGVRVIRLGNLGAGAFRDEDQAFITEEHYQGLQKHEAQPGDLLIAALADPVGRCCKVPEGLGTAIVKADCLRFRPNPSLQSDLIMFWLNSPSGKAWVEKLSHGIGRLRISLKDLKEVPMPLPPLNEQRRIVAKIEALMARSGRAKEALDAIPALLDRYRQSVLAAAFRGDLTADWRTHHPDTEPASELLERIREQRRLLHDQANRGGRSKRYQEPARPDANDLPDLPPSWLWVRWEEVGFCQNGRAFPSADYTNNGVKLLRPGNLYVSGRLEWTEKNTRCMPERYADQHPSYLVGPSELIMNLTAQSLADEFLGRVCLTDSNEHCLLNQRLARLTPVGLSPRFCLWLFKSPVFRRYVEAGLNTGSLIQHMFTSNVDQFVFPLPPAAEQDAIVESVEHHLSTKDTVDAEAGKAAAALPKLNQSILAKAFRGELVPQDPNDEPAPELLARIKAARAATATPTRRGRRQKHDQPQYAE